MIFGYPQEIVKKDKDLIENIAYGHELGHEIQSTPQSIQSADIYKIDEPIPLVVADLNLSTMCLNGETIIEYGLPSDEKVELKIYNILGQNVRTLVDENQKAGRYKMSFNAVESNLASGIYIYRIKAGNYVKAHKLLFIK